MTSPFPAYHRQKNKPVRNRTFLCNTAFSPRKTEKKHIGAHRRQTDMTPAHIDNALQKEHPVFKEKSNCPDTCSANCFRQPKIQKKERTPVRRVLSKKENRSDISVRSSYCIFHASFLTLLTKVKNRHLFSIPALELAQKMQNRVRSLFLLQRAVLSGMFSTMANRKACMQKSISFLES